MDFESPDDLDTRYKRQRKTSESHEMMLSPKTKHSSKPEEVFIKEENMKHELDYEDYHDHGVDNSEFENDFDDPNADADSSLDSMGSSDENEMEDFGNEQESQGFRRLDEHTDVEAPAQSLYLMEKSNRKRLVIKDGKIVAKTKAQRKDKGKDKVLECSVKWDNSNP